MIADRQAQQTQLPGIEFDPDPLASITRLEREAARSIAQREIEAPLLARFEEGLRTAAGAK